MLYQKTFQLVAELTAKVEATRLQASIPGSTPQAGPVLFGKDEVQAAAQVQNSFNGGIFDLRPLGQSFHFCPSFTGGFRENGYKGFRPAFKGQKGRSRGWQPYGAGGHSKPWKGGTRGRGSYKGIRRTRGKAMAATTQ